MLRSFGTIVSCAIAALFIITGIFPFEAMSQEYQKTPIALHASQALDANLLRGSNYAVKDAVVSDGFINIYDLDTTYGPVRVESTALLMKRIGELKALSAIEQLKGSSVYLDAARQAAIGPVKTAQGLVLDPVGTVSGVATGVGRVFSNVGSAITSDNPYQGKALNSALGQASYKREYAYQFGVDPYTTFPPLQKALNDLAWTAAVGGLTVKAAFMAIPGGAGLAVGLTGTAGTLVATVRDKTPVELAQINRSSLSAMGVSELVAQHFMENMYYDPQEQTLLVGALANMRNTADRGVLIEAAATANDESTALFHRVHTQLADLYNTKREPVQRFVELGGIPVLQTKSGKIVALFPLDYVAWTAPFAGKTRAFADALKQMKGIKGKEFLITGKVDPAMRKAMESKGWKVEDRVREKLAVY